MLIERGRNGFHFLLALILIFFLLPCRIGNGAGGYTGLPVTIDLTAANVSSHEVVLTWSDVSATGYTLYEKDSYVDTVYGTATVRRLLNPDTLYCYRVVAFYPDVGSTEQSNQACVKTLPDRTPPTVPGNVVADPDAQGRVRVSWSGSKDDAIVSGYTVFRDGVPVGEVADTSFVDEGLDAGALYCYSISSHDDSGNESDQSDLACAYSYTNDFDPK
ncbi:MAG: hypothetical protein GTO40_28745 [Deltaproteobacteria bacterium]|nr:hypothetical protein [Deltaproteobacteria bacterium]NIO16680.1 hypothetical protein [Deltaproteobacteria bacterium]NIS77391.1 hypothetical protein [Deltaproteobacteria bacterium]